MAIADQRVKSKKAARRIEHEQPFAEIDAKQLRRVQKDSSVQQLHSAADQHLETLLTEGRIDL
jgi:hypothetical protein